MENTAIEKEVKKDKKIRQNSSTEEIKKQIVIALIPMILNFVLNYAIVDTYFLFFMHISTFLLSIFIMYMIYTLIFALVKKAHIATYIMSIVIFILSIINGIKMYYTNATIFFSDINFLGNLGEITGIVKNDIFNHLNYGQFGILLVLLILICVIAKKNTITLESNKIRIAIGIIDILFLMIFVIPINAKDKWILNNIFNVKNRKDYTAILTGENYYAKYGVLAGMYGMELENRQNEPNGYNEEEVKSALNKASAFEKENNLQKPNIIVMFQESYWDVENISEVEFDKDVTKDFDDLKGIGSSVNLLSPSYGGMSSNIEFEMLTGGNLAYYGVGYNPFLQLYRKSGAEEKPSIIKELKSNGYNTKVIFGRDYYMSENIYKKLGIDEYTNTYRDMQDYEEKIKGDYISDEALVDEVLNILNEKNEEPVFCMVATIQTHMPFESDKYDKYDIQVTNTSLSEEDTGIILSYAQGVYDTNKQIKRLYQEIQNMEKETILVVLGDHLPYLYNEKGEDILLKLNYFNTGDEKLNLLRKYSTEALVISNYDAKINFESEYISPDMLLTNIINNMDIDISSYYKWLYSIRNILPAQNQYMTIDKDMNIYIENEMTEEMKKTMDLRENIQYFLFNKK